MFYKRVKQLCDAYPIAISTLARKLHLSPSAPNNWKEGTLPKADTIIKISEFFNVSCDFLLLGFDKKSENPIVLVNQTCHSEEIVRDTFPVQWNDIQSFEAEIVRIYRKIGLKGKAALMQYAFSLEEEANNAKDGES